MFASTAFIMAEAQTSSKRIEETAPIEINNSIEQSRGVVCNFPTNLFASNITSNSAQLNWSPAIGALSYTVDFKESSRSIFFVLGTTYATSILLPNLLPNTSYDFEVRSNCRNGVGSFASVIFRFTTAAATSTSCATPTGLNSLNDCFSVDLNWDVVPSANSYNVQYKLNASSTWITAVTATPNNYFTLVANPGVYNWRVQSNCNTGLSGFATRNVTILTQAQCYARNSQNSNNDLTNTKNAPIEILTQPAHNTALLKYNSLENTGAIIKIFDMYGKLALTKKVTLINGFNNINVEINNLKQGSYLLQLQTKKTSEVVKLLVN